MSKESILDIVEDFAEKLTSAEYKAVVEEIAKVEDKCKRFHIYKCVLEEIIDMHKFHDSVLVEDKVEDAVNILLLDLLCFYKLFKKRITIKDYLETVKEDGYNLRYIDDKEKTEEMCLEAVKQKGIYLRYVPYNLRTKDVCIKALINSEEFIWDLMPDELVNELRKSEPGI